MFLIPLILVLKTLFKAPSSHIASVGISSGTSEPNLEQSSSNEIRFDICVACLNSGLGARIVLYQFSRARQIERIYVCALSIQPQQSVSMANIDTASLFLQDKLCIPTYSSAISYRS